MMRAPVLIYATLVVAGCTAEPSLGSHAQAMTSETIVVYGEAPPDCRETHGAGWDNTYDGGGSWAGCECTLGCSSGPTDEAPSGGGDDGSGTGGGGGGGGGSIAAEQYLRTKDCLQTCDGYRFDWFDDCMSNGFYQPDQYCPVERSDEQCPGASDLCHVYLLNADGSRIPRSCFGSKSPYCASAFSRCEYGWRNALTRQAEALRTSCRKVATDRVATCQWSCLRDLGRGLLCDYYDSTMLLDNGRIDAHGWCAKEGVSRSCVELGTDAACQLGPAALD